MPRSATRFNRHLLAFLARPEHRLLPAAEVWRRVGAEAAKLGVPRPSYERVRVLTRELRRKRPEPTTADVLLDIAFRARPPEALLEHVSGRRRTGPLVAEGC